MSRPDSIPNLIRIMVEFGSFIGYLCERACARHDHAPNKGAPHKRHDVARRKKMATDPIDRADAQAAARAAANNERDALDTLFGGAGLTTDALAMAYARKAIAAALRHGEAFTWPAKWPVWFADAKDVSDFASLRDIVEPELPAMRELFRAAARGTSLKFGSAVGEYRSLYGRKSANVALINGVACAILESLTLAPISTPSANPARSVTLPTAFYARVERPTK